MSTSPTHAGAKPLSLGDEQLQHYRDQGYLLVRGLIPPEAMKAVRDRLMQIAESAIDWPTETLQVMNPEKHRNPKGGFVPAGVQLPARHDDVFAAVADHPRLQQAMSQLLGGPVTRFTDQCLIKPGWLKETQGARSFYHQDSYYWKLQPRLGCNAWIPTDEVGRDAIALAVMPGSHRDWTLVEHEQYYDDPSYHNAITGQAFQRHRIPEARIDYAKEDLVEMSPGDALFFTNYTWHRSEPNYSGETKAAYAIAYRLAEAVKP